MSGINLNSGSIGRASIISENPKILRDTGSGFWNEFGGPADNSFSQIGATSSPESSPSVAKQISVSPRGNTGFLSQPAEFSNGNYAFTSYGTESDLIVVVNLEDETIVNTFSLTRDLNVTTSGDYADYYGFTELEDGENVAVCDGYGPGAGGVFGVDGTPKWYLVSNMNNPDSPFGNFTTTAMPIEWKDYLIFTGGQPDFEDAAIAKVDKTDGTVVNSNSPSTVGGFYPGPYQPIIQKNDVLYAATEDTPATIHKFDLTDLSYIGGFQTPSPAEADSAIMVSPEEIYTASPVDSAGSVFRINAVDETMTWETPRANLNVSEYGPVTASKDGSNLCLVDGSGRVSILDKANGDEVAASSVSISYGYSGWMGTQDNSGNMLAGYSDTDCNLVSIDSSDGTENWSFSAPSNYEGVSCSITSNERIIAIREEYSSGSATGNYIIDIFE